MFASSKLPMHMYIIETDSQSSNWFNEHQTNLEWTNVYIFLSKGKRRQGMHRHWNVLQPLRNENRASNYTVCRDSNRSSNTGSKSFQTSLTFREFQAQYQTKAIRILNTVQFANVYEGFCSNMHISFLVPDRAGAWLLLLQVSVKFTRLNFAHFCKMLPAFAGFCKFSITVIPCIYPQEHFYLFSDDSRFFATRFLLLCIADFRQPTFFQRRKLMMSAVFSFRYPS